MTACLLSFALVMVTVDFDHAYSAPEETTSKNSNARSTAMPAVAVGHPTFISPHFPPITLHGDCVYVVNTPADTFDVIDREIRALIARVNVGVDPVSVAVRPDGKEIWILNHISDSVSVIDIDNTGPTKLQVIATIHAFDLTTKTTKFDEPVGIAFASSEKAYVALSSENQIAVVNVATRKIKKRLMINA